MRLDVLRAAVDEFDRRLALVGDGQWSLPTPCTDWDVRALVEHVVDGNELAVELLGGVSGARSGSPVARVRTSAADMLAAFSVPGVGDRVCAHPADTISAPSFVVYRAGDIAVHSWDLARAIGADENLDADLVDAVLTHYLPWVSTLDPAGVFAGAPPIPLGATPQQRLLAALGRSAV